MISYPASIVFKASDEKVVSAPAAASAAVKVIPRLVDSTGATPLSRNVGGRDGGLDPSTWDAEDVSSFLGINECATLVDSFKEQASKSASDVAYEHFNAKTCFKFTICTGQGDHGGLTLGFVEFNLGIPTSCLFVMPSLGNFHLPKQNRGDRGTTK